MNIIDLTISNNLSSTVAPDYSINFEVNIVQTVNIAVLSDIYRN